MATGVPHGLSRTAAMGALGAEMARMRFAGSGSGRERARLAVAERLGALRGLPQKLGQIVSVSELSGPSQAFRDLGAGAAPLDREAFLAGCEAEWGFSWKDLFAEVSAEGVAASLAQVHRARMHDGREVAVKLLLPGIESAVWSDLGALGWLTAPVGGLNRGFDLQGYRNEIRSLLEDELDMGREAATLDRVAALSAGHDWLMTPRAFPEGTRRRVLTMSWVDGAPFEATRTWPVEDRAAVFERLLEFALLGFLDWRLIHGDLHPGNLRFSRGATGVRLGALDFGCIKSLSERESGALSRLMTSGGAVSAEESVGLLAACGFDEAALRPMANKLPVALRALFAPFATDGPFDASAWRLGDRFEEALGEDRWTFRMAGPPTLLVLIRAFQGLVQYAKATPVSVNWRAALDRVSHGGAPSAFGLDADSGASDRRLWIRVTESGRVKAKAGLAASAAARLEEVMPDRVLSMLQERGMDPLAIGREAAQRGYPPGELFTLDEGDRQVRVWLE